MTNRRAMLKALAAAGAYAMVGSGAAPAAGKVRVTLVRWPFT